MLFKKQLCEIMWKWKKVFLCIDFIKKLWYNIGIKRKEEKNMLSLFIKNYLASKKPESKEEKEAIIKFLLDNKKIEKSDISKVKSILKVYK